MIEPYEMWLTNERLTKQYSSSFQLIAHAIDIASNMVRSGIFVGSNVSAAALKKIAHEGIDV